MTRGALYRVRHVAVAMAVAALTDARLVEVGASSFEDEDGDTGILNKACSHHKSTSLTRVETDKF